MIFYRFLKNLILYIQYTRALKQAYKQENVISNLSDTFGTTFKKDWIGRLYTVFNPNLVNGKFDRNNPIYSYNEKGLNTDEFVRQYILTKLSVIDHFVNARNLFELVTYEIKRLDNYDNFLFIIKPIPFDDLMKYLKLLWIPILVIAAGITGAVIFL